jgi:hypothetical protein
MGLIWLPEYRMKCSTGLQLLMIHLKAVSERMREEKQRDWMALVTRVAASTSRGTRLGIKHEEKQKERLSVLWLPIQR